MRVLILGGGGLMGSGTIKDLLWSGVTDIVAADVDLSRVPEAVERRQVDVASLDWETLLADCDLCVNGVPTFAGHQMRIFEACLRAGKTYVDYGGMGVYTVQQKAFHVRFQEAGVTAVIGLGADPGLSNVLCRAVADRLETIDRINLYWASTRLGPVSPALVAPYSLSTVLSEYANPSQQFLDGELREVPAREGVEVVELPPPWGATKFMFSQHSEPLTVPFAQGIAEKGIREFTWRLSFPHFDHEAWVGLVRAGFGDYDTPVSVPGGTVKPLDVLAAVMARHAASTAAPAGEMYEIHFAVGHGTVSGEPRRVEVRVVGKPDPLYEGYADAGTSMNMSIGVQLIARHPARPGVWAPEEYFDPEEYLAEVTRRRFEVSVEIS